MTREPADTVTPVRIKRSGPSKASGTLRSVLIGPHRLQETAQQPRDGMVSTVRDGLLQGQSPEKIPQTPLVRPAGLANRFRRQHPSEIEARAAEMRDLPHTAARVHPLTRRGLAFRSDP